MIRKVLHDQPVLRIRGTWDMPGGTNPIPAALGEIDTVIEHQGLNLAGPPYWICSNSVVDSGGWQWEAGVPVNQPGVDEGRVAATILPGGEVASIYYQGPFEQAEAVHAYFRGEIEAAGLQPDGEVRWIGLTDPARVSSPDEHYSELNWPVSTAP